MSGRHSNPTTVVEGELINESIIRNSDTLPLRGRNRYFDLRSLDQGPLNNGATRLNFRNNRKDRLHDSSSLFGQLFLRDVVSHFLLDFDQSSLV